MKPQIPIIGGFLLLTLPFAGLTQPAIEFASGSGPAGSGSVLTNQVITFQNNALNPATGTYTPLVPTTTATFSISNQQYTLPATQNPNGGDVTFGATINATGALINSAALFPSMNTVSGAPASDFSSTQNNINAGIDMTNNYATELFTSAEGLYNANAATNGRYLMANLTITFNLPITNPVLHIVGLGGTFGALGLTTELQLTTPGFTLSELSGSPELNVTANSILNSAALPTGTTGSGAASGSILVSGTMTSLTFQLYLRGDDKAPTWSNAHEHTGDAWLIGVSALNTFVALPVGYTAFTAESQQHTVNLQWTTATEQSSKYFAIQRSADNTTWTTIGQVTAAGNSDKTLQYAFEDEQPLTGVNYYRIHEVNDISTSLYSPVRNVDFAGSPLMVNWYPNPTRDRLTISGYNNLQSLTLTTLDGRTLQSYNKFAPGQSIDLSRYPFGIYFLLIRTTDGQSRVAKIERN